MIKPRKDFPSPESCVPKLIPAIPVTRRKWVTFILDAPESFMWAGTNIEDALQWLAEKGFESVEVISPTGIWSLQYQRTLTEQDGELWLGQPHHSSDSMPPDK
jgi:hypothetical protein